MVYYAAWNGLPWHTKHSKDMRCKTWKACKKHGGNAKAWKACKTIHQNAPKHTERGTACRTRKRKQTMLGMRNHARHAKPCLACKGMQGTHRMQNMQGIMHDIYTRHEKPTEHAHSVCTTCAVSTHILHLTWTSHMCAAIA